MFVLLFGAEVAVIGNCSQSPDEPATWVKAIGALAEGLLFGGSSYAIVQAFYPERLPSSVLSPFPRKTAKDLKPGSNGKMVDDKGNPYVCLPSGQCIPDLSTAEAKKGFAKELSMGTGAPPNVANCPASN
jgi:hypothetical protein